MTAIDVPTGPTSRSTTHCTAAWGWLGPGNVDTARSEFMIRQLRPPGRKMQLGGWARYGAIAQSMAKIMA